MLARFSAASGISKRCFGLDLALLVPGLSRAESKAYEFFHSHARASARAREVHLRRAANPWHVCDKRKYDNFGERRQGPAER